MTGENAEQYNWDLFRKIRFSVFRFECIVNQNTCRWRVWIPLARIDLNKGR